MNKEGENDLKREQHQKCLVIEEGGLGLKKKEATRE